MQAFYITGHLYIPCLIVFLKSPEHVVWKIPVYQISFQKIQNPDFVVFKLE